MQAKRKPKPAPSARGSALYALTHCLDKHSPLDTAWTQDANFAQLSGPDRAFAQLITKTTIRRLGQINALIDELLQRPLPAEATRAKNILRMGIAQLIWLETPPHAAVNESVNLSKSRGSESYSGLINAVLKKVDQQGRTITEKQDAAKLNTPGWLWDSWVKTYGEDTTRKIAATHMSEPALDITVKKKPEQWASVLDATALITGSLRLKEKGNITKLDGFEEGAWWVQDAAASIPVQLLVDVADKNVLDLCAAPGGKTAQLAAAGANVTAVDISASRMRILQSNLDRLKLKATCITADIGKWKPDNTPDAILLDAPCSATGTLRRHPDVAWNKQPSDITRLCATQEKLLNHALDMLKPGGKLVYAVCSLQPEEGEQQIASALKKRDDIIFTPAPDRFKAFRAAKGEIRTLPCHMAESGGMDGFYAALLTKK